MCDCDPKPATKGDLAARAVLCHVCPHACKAGPIWSASVSCTISGHQVGQHVLSGQCPEGIYGLIRARWSIGLFAPLRWLAVCLGAPRAAVRLIPGCGCVRVLKRAWLTLSGQDAPRGL